MHYTLKKDEVESIKNFHQSSPVAKMIQQYNNWGFEVGDVLVRYRAFGDGCEIENVSEACKVPKKFRVVYIDEQRIPWVKQILVRGGLGNKIHCLINYHQPNITWELDPEQIDATLLGYEYSPRAQYRQMRTENSSYGGKKTDQE